MAKTKKKTKKQQTPVEDAQSEKPPSTPSVEESVDLVQYTDTSYTSASFETPHSISAVSDSLVKKKKIRPKQVYGGSKQDRIDFDIPIESELGPKKKKRGKGKEKKQKDDDIPFEKPHNWKKMTPKEKTEWLNQRMLQHKQEMDAERQIRKENRRKNARLLVELITQEVNKQDIRKDILAKTCVLFKKYMDAKEDYEENILRRKKWKVYTLCNGMPDPTEPSHLNAYLRKWTDTSTYHDCTEQELMAKFYEVVTTLNVMDTFMVKAYPMSDQTKENINSASAQLRSQLLKTIDCTSFHLLRDWSRNLEAVGSTVAIYHKDIRKLNINMWVAIKQPTRLKKHEHEELGDVIIHFPTLNLDLTLTPAINTKDISVRVMRNGIDLLSKTCKTYDLAYDMPRKDESLFDLSVREFNYVLAIKKENDRHTLDFFKDINEKIKELERLIKNNQFLKMDKEKAELEKLQLTEPPELLGGHNPRERIIKENEDELIDYLILNAPIVSERHINLRQYRILGGILHIDLFETPPQTKYIRHGIWLSTLSLPIQLKDIVYKVDYEPFIEPDPERDTRTPEQIHQQREENEELRQKLIMVKLQIPQNFVCFKEPVLCHWDSHNCVWTTDCLFSIIYDRRHATMQFRTKNLWPIGIAVEKFINVPYKSWEMKAGPFGRGVLFILEGEYLKVVILCRKRHVFLKEISFPNTDIMDFTYFNQYINKALTVKKLKSVLQNAGVDIFPDFDAHNYVEGSCIKNWVLERHMYHAMAFLSKSYCFKSSKWNASAGMRNIVIQMKEIVDNTREYKYNLLHATPECATYLKISEDVEEFDTEPAVEMDFYPDLFTFNMAYGSILARKRSFEIKYDLTEVIYELLKAIKPCSFC